VPTIACVRAIKICIYAGDHPPAHFHARNANGTEAVIAIGNFIMGLRAPLALAKILAPPK
jgi:hypothetical protein